MDKPDLSESQKQELLRIKRVSDMLCTAHSFLRDKYWVMNVAIEVFTIISTFALTVVALADETLLGELFSFNLNTRLWSGVVAAAIFAVTLMQLVVKWSEKAQAHSKSARMYSEVKREATYLLLNFENSDPKEFQRLADRYDMVSETGTTIPDHQFIKLKRRHEIKVAISKSISKNPGALIWFEKIRILYRDNKISRGRNEE
ncbi:hypothetical protein [uncultured Sulfitobacter sp.]|uniref:hypothetical protein n=1 Tax=uncultured Sulfitobacter sp. TaxID=191468 RepID=UPI002591581C|nr:hypothetical protein [uncultured Sulfitobacter sp.]